MNYHPQPSLFYDFNIFVELPLHKKFYELFSNLDLSKIKDTNIFVGRTGYSRHAMFRALIVKNILQLNSIPRLIYFLKNNLFICDLCAFYNYQIPDETQFYRFINELDTSLIHDLMIDINNQFMDIKKKTLPLESVSIDSKPILAKTRENNPKYHNRNHTNKHKKPKRNPTATLGYYATHLNHKGEKVTDLKWGYRTHCIIDNLTGVTLIEFTLPNNLSDNKVAEKLFEALSEHYDISSLKNIFGDKAYDDKKLKSYIRKLIGENTSIFFSRNPRNSKPSLYTIPGPICESGLEMIYDSILPTNKNQTKFRIKFRCPVASRSTSNFSCCAGHQSLCSGKKYGCVKYLSNISKEQAVTLKEFIRSSKLKPASIRIAVEQYFSRFQAIAFEGAPYFLKNSIKNHSAIAHLTLSLVALTAYKLGKPHKTRCYLSLTA